MSNRIDVTTLLDGPKHALIHVFMQADGSGEIDSYDLTSGIDGAPYYLEDVTWAFSGFAAKLHFELLVNDTLIWVLPEFSDYIDFTKYGGIKDKGNPLDATGKLLITTTGFTNIGDEGSLIIRLKKYG